MPGLSIKGMLEARWTPLGRMGLAASLRAVGSVAGAECNAAAVGFGFGMRSGETWFLLSGMRG